MAVTAMAMPNRPASLKATMMPAMITMVGSAVDSSETARPWITFVPWPVTEDWAMDRTGRKPTPV